MNFAKNIKECCRDKGLNVKQLAKLVNIQDSLLYKYINESCTPTVKNVVKLADFFETSVDYLLGLSDNEDVKVSKGYSKNVFYLNYEKLLKENNISHYSVCQKLKISISSLLSWKKGSLPYLDTLCKLAKYFNTSVDFLIGRADEY